MMGSSGDGSLPWMEDSMAAYNTAMLSSNYNTSNFAEFNPAMMVPFDQAGSVINNGAGNVLSTPSRSLHTIQTPLEPPVVSFPEPSRLPPVSTILPEVSGIPAPQAFASDPAYTLTNMPYFPLPDMSAYYPSYLPPVPTYQLPQSVYPDPEVSHAPILPYKVGHSQPLLHRSSTVASVPRQVSTSHVNPLQHPVQGLAHPPQHPVYRAVNNPKYGAVDTQLLSQGVVTHNRSESNATSPEEISNTSTAVRPGDVFPAPIAPTANDDAATTTPVPELVLPALHTEDTDIPSKKGTGSDSDQWYEEKVETPAGMMSSKRKDKQRRNHKVQAHRFYKTKIPKPEGWGVSRTGNVRSSEPVFTYTNQGQLDSWILFDEQKLQFYIKYCPRKLRIWLQNCPAQVNCRLDKELDQVCRYAHCPSNARCVIAGWHRIVFDEFYEETSDGRKDPFKVAGAMHLWCFEQLVDPHQLYRSKILAPDIRTLPQEERNPMALNRDSDKGIVRAAFKPWMHNLDRLQHDIWKGKATPTVFPRPHNESLSYALVVHHLANQTKARQETRAKRNAKRTATERKTIDVHLGDLSVYAGRNEEEKKRKHAQALRKKFEKQAKELGAQSEKFDLDPDIQSQIAMLQNLTQMGENVNVIEGTPNTVQQHTYTTEQPKTPEYAQQPTSVAYTQQVPSTVQRQASAYLPQEAIGPSRPQQHAVNFQQRQGAGYIRSQIPKYAPPQTSNTVQYPVPSYSQQEPTNDVQQPINQNMTAMSQNQAYYNNVKANIPVAPYPDMSDLSYNPAFPDLSFPDSSFLEQMTSGALSQPQLQPSLPVDPKFASIKPVAPPPSLPIDPELTFVKPVTPLPSRKPTPVQEVGINPALISRRSSPRPQKTALGGEKQAAERSGTPVSLGIAADDLGIIKDSIHVRTETELGLDPIYIRSDSEEVEDPTHGNTGPVLVHDNFVSIDTIDTIDSVDTDFKEFQDSGNTSPPPENDSFVSNDTIDTNSVHAGSGKVQDTIHVNTSPVPVHDSISVHFDSEPAQKTVDANAGERSQLSPGKKRPQSDVENEAGNQQSEVSSKRVRLEPELDSDYDSLFGSP
ncbi:hypothetical protein BGZ63DRAFT_437027 [Mariannaea sp. PMI_226]|nr:hypothetical protein BGZ63DRAFT_437027 [Mariannaea sp. PMI_226]